MSENKINLSQNISRRPYRPGDQDNIVDFLNISYPKGWGDIKQMRWYYVDYPTATKDSLFILETEGKIVGFRGVSLRDLIIPSVGRTCTASFGSTAVHPNFRRFGAYSRLHQATLEVARSNKACMVFTWNSRGTVTYKHNKKTGFAEVKRGAYYWKIFNYERVFKSELKELIRSLVKGLESSLYLGVGNSLFPVAEILGEESDLAKARKKVTIIFSESAFPLMFKFMQGGKLQKVTSLFLLLLSRRMKIRFTSLGTLLKLAWKGIKIIV
jgi:GNAT superfamily N-acetyltransferase